MGSYFSPRWSRLCRCLRTFSSTIEYPMTKNDNNRKTARGGRPRGRQKSPIRVVKGQSLQRFVEARRKAIAACDAAPDVKAAATNKLESVATQIGRWEIHRPDTPNLPNRPPFYPKPANGKSYSQIPIPTDYRGAFKGRNQRTKKWSGNGISAWCHYLAEIDDQVAYFANPPEAARLALPKLSRKNDLDNLDALKGRSDAKIGEVADYLFESRVVTKQVTSEQLAAIRNGWDWALSYFEDNNRVRIDSLDLNTLYGFRNFCAAMLRKSERSLRTVNGYLGATRRVLGWIDAHCAIDLPAFRAILMNFTGKEADALGKQEGSSPGAKQFGRAETVALPIPALRRWFDAVKDDPFELAVTLCSLNLAAGASDLSDLRFLDDSVQNLRPAVDIDRGYFVTYRSKTRLARCRLSCLGAGCLHPLDTSVPLAYSIRRLLGAVPDHARPSPYRRSCRPTQRSAFRPTHPASLPPSRCTASANDD